MRGFELVLKQGMSLNLSSLFHGIDFGGVTIHVVQSEIINQKTFVHHDHYMADCLASAMKGLPYHLDGLIHNLLAFVYPKDALPSEIRTYEDYLESNCILALLVYDVSYVELYAKSPEVLEQLWNNASKLPVAQLDIKTDETDLRTEFYV